MSAESLLLGSSYIGIEHFSSGTEERASVLLIRKNKDGLVIKKQDTQDFLNISQIASEQKIPAWLTINSNQVLQKKVPATDSIDEKLLHKCFPNINLSDFEFEIWRLKAESIVAICRKTYTEDLLSRYKQAGYNIVGFSLGVTALSKIMSFTDQRSIITNHYLISLDQEVWIEKTDEVASYTINGIDIENKSILPFSGVLSLLMPIDTTTSSFKGQNRATLDRYLQNQFFTKAFKGILVALVAILLVNFVAFSHYFRLAGEMSEQIAATDSQRMAIQKITARLKEKQKEFAGISNLAAFPNAVVINKIAEKVPPQILLTQLTFQPLENKIKAEEPIKLLPKNIFISGSTIENQAFTKWVKEIENLQWIEKVVIVYFGKDDDNKTVFKIKLLLK